MSYKTIVVHANAAPHASDCVRLAGQIAVAEQAHLIGVATSGLAAFFHQYSALAPMIPMLPEDLNFLTERADQALARFSQEAGRLALSSIEGRRIDDDSEDGVAMAARYADLVVLGQARLDEAGPRDELAQFVVMHSACPVLIVPHAGHFAQVGRAPLIAWDGSRAARRAIDGALPLLRQAGKAVLVVFNAAEKFKAHGEQPGADMALFLARHGVKVEVRQAHSDADIGQALLSLADEIEADLLVMGAYGHSRLREIVLGGATRTVLECMTLPVLMAH